LEVPLSSRLWVRSVESVASTARPIAPPTCMLVLTSPEASPESSIVAPDIARVMIAGKAEPMPMPISRNGGNRSVR
jgi:hypothetical protein